MNEDKKIIGYSGSAPVEGVGGAQVQGLGITQNGNSPITATSLQPSTPFKSPATPVTTTAQGISGIASSVKDSGLQQQETDRKLQEIQAKKNEDSNSLQSLYNDIAGVQSSRSTLENEAGLNAKAQRATDYTNKLEASERAQTNELRALEQASGSGMSVQGKAEAQAAINRKYAFEQADLALLQSAANRDYATAQGIVDRKIELQLEPLKTKLEARKFSYEENKEQFNTQEKRKIEADLRAEERQLNQEETRRQEIGKLLTQVAVNGGSQEKLNQIENAKDYAEAIKIAGPLAGDLLDREIKKATLDRIYADIAEKKNGGIVVDTTGKVVLKPEEASKINKELVSNDAYKAIRKGQDSLQFLKSFETLFNETGATSGVFDPVKNAKLKAEYNSAILNLKEFFNLGVLNGPDEKILRGVLPDPTNTSNVARVASLGIYQPQTSTRAGIDSMKEMIETTIDDRFKSLSAQYGDYSSESLGSLKDLQRVYISQKAALNPKVSTFISENPNLTYEDIISVIANQ